MASISNVNFSYPVLCEYNDDYVDSTFIGGSNGTLIKQNKKAIIETYVELNNNELINLINSNKADIIVKLYCPSTKFRNIYHIHMGMDRVVVDYKNINKKVLLETYIVATERIDHFVNSKFNADYEGASFIIEKGSILAIGKNEYIELEKDPGDLSDVSCVIKIKNSNLDEGPMYTEFDGDYLKIFLNKNEFDIYRKYSEHELPIVNSMIIVPGIMDALDKVSQDEDESVYDRRWFKALKKKAETAKKIDLTIEYLKNNGSFELVQTLLDCPIVDAMKSLDRGEN